MNETARTFIARRKESQLSPVKSSKTFGIAYDDPDMTEPEDFRFDICGSVAAEVPVTRKGS